MAVYLQVDGTFGKATAAWCAHDDRLHSSTLTNGHGQWLARLLLPTNRAGGGVATWPSGAGHAPTGQWSNHPWTKESARITADALGRAAAIRNRYGLEDSK
jgi:hypothetical protein